MGSLLRDLKFSARSLLKHPGFTAVVVLTLALGIGANTTIFSTVDALILHPFSFPNQDRLVVVWEQNRAVGVGMVRGSVAPGNFTEWLIFVALLARLIPTRRATKVDPLVGLRYE